MRSAVAAVLMGMALLAVVMLNTKGGPTLPGVARRLFLVADEGIVAGADVQAFSAREPWEPFIRDLCKKADAPVPMREEEPGKVLGYMLRSNDLTNGKAESGTKGAPSWLAGFLHYRLLPGIFEKDMLFHFDGLATPLRFSFDENGEGAPSLSWLAKPFESPAFKDYSSCLFYGTGTGPTLGSHLCYANPGVNLLPLSGPDSEGQLWLTIDTSSWGQVDPQTLATLPGKAEEANLVLNAHPACEGARGGRCFVQHPCPPLSPGGLPGPPLSDDVCFSELHATDGNVKVTEISRSKLPYEKLIQHSHSPCITPNFLLSKLDAFHSRNPVNENGGLLKFVHQGEDNLWLLMDRHTNQSRVLESGSTKFINNHFWNCYEDPKTGAIVVETVATTGDYLDVYFQRNLQADMDWAKRFQAPLRCHVPTKAEDTKVVCEPLSTAFPAKLPFDYPTFNPLFKMRPDYRYFYAITPASTGSRWFDKIMKVDVSQGGGAVVASWSAPGVYVTEADFVPRTESTDAKAEDDGVLLSVLYNESAGESSLAVFDAASLTLLDQYALGGVVPFHAHGIVCPKGQLCFPNP